MRSALLCVFFALIAQKQGCRADTEEDFKPTPIPLNDWRLEKKEIVGTLQEAIKTDAPPTAAAVPAHYWEDALRHSVYLTLVRDKIDQLIAKGVVISPDSKPDNDPSKELDDHDLWEKIKNAPFDRLKEDPIPPGDVTVLARGRLLHETSGFRFAEDEASPGACSNTNCTKSVKAFWSVKRVRQRDVEPSSGKFHYELTFSVTSQTPRKLKKPFENPVRTFTIRENAPTEPPPFTRNYDTISTRYHPGRPQRAIWVHKNIAPLHNQRVRQGGELDRLFTSFFSDEDRHDEHPQRLKTNNFAPSIYSQFSKIGFAGEREPFYQKKPSPTYSIKAQSYKFSRPPLGPPPLPFVQHYLDMDSLAKSPYMPMHTDNKYMANIIKTTRPAVLPTPLAPYTMSKESTVDVPFKTIFNTSEYTTKFPEFTAINSFKLKPASTKISYSAEHVRPPVYNAPPGVFVTMDKKPFKPMPPLKQVHSSIPAKAPLDFRPSPQIIDDAHFSDPDFNTAFRPIPAGFSDAHNNNNLHKEKKTYKNMRKFSANNKKPTTKQDNTKLYSTPTTTPDIVTADSESDDSIMQWGNILGAITKTTPMDPYNILITTEANESNTSVTPVITTEADSEEHKIEHSTTTSTTTTPKPTKRTRPPPKFKQQKLKKLKRITTTTTATTTKATTTRAPKKPSTKKVVVDLTPQASSAPTSGANSLWETKTKFVATTTIKPMTSTNATATTTQPATTTKLPTITTTIVETKKPIAGPASKDKNRFRQSTLMIKGTSVKHDRWSSPQFEKNRTSPVSSSNLYMRRKGSKFQGYLSSTTTPVENIEKNKDEHEDTLNKKPTDITSTESSKENVVTPQSVDSNTNETNDTSTLDAPQDLDKTQKDDEDIDEEDKENYVEVSKDDDEYIFSTSTTENTSVDNDHTDSSTVEQASVTTQVYVPKNKTKCKKKKHDNILSTEETKPPNESTSTTTTTTVKSTTSDILEDLFGGFTMDDEDNETKRDLSTPIPDVEQSGSEDHERFVDDDSLERFLESLEGKNNHRVEDDKTDNEYDDSTEDSSEDEDSPFISDEEDIGERKFDDEDYYEDERQKTRPYSLLELISME